MSWSEFASKNVNTSKMLSVHSYGGRVGTYAIVCHHTAITERNTPPGHVQNVINYVNSKNPQLGYHFIIDRDGTIYQLQDIDGRVAHGMEANKSTISICMQAADNNDTTEKQGIAGANLARALIEHYRISPDAMYCHGEIENKLAVTFDARRKANIKNYNRGDYGRMTDEGLQIVKRIRTKFPPEEIYKKICDAVGVAVGGQPSGGGTQQSIPDLPVETADKYIERVYTSVYSSPTITPLYNEKLLPQIKSYKNTVLTESGMNGDERLLLMLNMQQSTIEGEIAGATRSITGFSSAAQRNLIDMDLYAADPDAMRSLMLQNADKYNPNTGPGTAHAWRAPGKLAITATFTIQGMSGFRIAQVFWLDRVSEFYKTFGVFQLFSLTENIDMSKGWTTELYSRFNAIPVRHMERMTDYNGDDPEAIKEAKDCRKT